MLKKYRALLLEEILSKGYSWNDFEICDEDLDTLQISIRYEKKFFFRAQENPETFHRFRAVYTKFEKNYPLVRDENFAPFDLLQISFRNWLDEVAHWMDEFGEMIRSNERAGIWLIAFTRIDFTDDELFNDADKVILKTDTETLTRQIKSLLDLPKEKQESLLKMVDGLINDSGRVTKPNWKAVARTLLRDAIVDAARDTASLQTLLYMFSYVIGRPENIPLPARF